MRNEKTFPTVCIVVIELIVVELLPFEFESQLFAVKSVRKG